MSDILSDVSLIIGYRQASADRKLGLQFVLNWLYKYLPEVEILLIEQDETQKIDVILPPTCKYHFTYNPGLYNRCWAFNVGINLTDKKIFAFSDSDMFMAREDYIRAFEACRTFQAVNPNGETVYNIVNADPEALTYEISEKRKLWTMAAGLLIMQREAVEMIAGWDERFEGWGGEDDAISHLTYHTLTNKTLDCMMYHVDHARSVFDGKTQPGYLYNRMLFEEITTLSGNSLKRYLEKRKKVPRGNPDKYRNPNEEAAVKQQHYVLAVTTFNRVKYIREFLESWDRTRSKDAKWTVIVADDGSPDGTLEYLDNVHFDGVQIIINKNKRLGIAGQTNTIIGKLMELEFDVCFCCNDDILFTKEGWDHYYREIIERTGYDHLCYFDTRWNKDHTLKEPFIRGQLCNYCPPENVQGCFFTLTPELIRSVGYFDTVHFGFRGLAHVDYTWRCCRGGFNVPITPFDALNSNEYIRTQKEDYILSIPGPLQSIINNEGEKKRKWKIIRQNRVFIPLNEINVMHELLEKHEKGEDVSGQVREFRKQHATPLPKPEPKPETKPKQEFKQEPEKILHSNEVPDPLNIQPPSANKRYVYLQKNKLAEIPVHVIKSALNKDVYTYANENPVANEGDLSFNGSLSKKLYNFLLHNRIHFIIKGMDKLANKMIKSGLKIKNIDK